MIYLNNAATCFPRPPLVSDAVARYLAAPPSDSHRGGAGGAPDLVQCSRRRLCRFLGIADPSRLAFTHGATDALNMALAGLSLEHGHVVTTQLEHNSLLRPLSHLERRGELEVTVVPCDRSGWVRPQQLAEALRPSTRLVALSHASNVTGMVQNIEEICALAHTRGILVLVDAAQSVGSVPIDVETMGVDLMALTFHKNLFGLPAHGALYVRDGLDLVPYRVGGTGIRSNARLQPEEMPLRLEAGTPNLPGLAALAAGLDFLEQRPLREIGQHKSKCVQRLREGLSELPQVEFYGARDAHLPIAAFNIRGVAPEQAGYVLREGYDIILRSGLHCAPLIHQALGCAPEGCLRASPSCFTTDDEIDALVWAVRDLAKLPQGLP